MKNRPILTISILTATTISIIALLIAKSQPDQNKNGFDRIYYGSKISEISRHSIDSKILRTVVGQMSSGYLFSGRDSVFTLFDSTLNTSKTFVLFNDSDNKIASPFHTYSSDTDLIIFSRPLRKIFYGRPFGRVDSVKSIPEPFSDAIRISSTSCIFRGNDKSDLNKVLFKYQTEKDSLFYEKDVSLKTNDMGFANDGKLFYDPKSSRVIYLHYYCNEFICMDTNLNLVYRGKSIDTFSHFRSKAKVFTTALGRHAASFSSPRKTVNQYADISDGKLYIQSLIKSDNETMSEFNNNSDIDVYQISSGKYLGSFHIPVINGRKMHHYRILNGKAVVLYDRTIVLYHCPI